MIMGSSPSVLVLPDPHDPLISIIVVLPIDGTVTNILRIGDEYVLSTQEGYFHHIAAADLPKCPACTFQTAQPLLQSTSGHRRRARAARALSVGAGAPPRRPWPLRRNATSGDPRQPRPGDSYRVALGGPRAPPSGGWTGLSVPVPLPEPLLLWPSLSAGDDLALLHGFAGADVGAAPAGAPQWPLANVSAGPRLPGGYADRRWHERSAAVGKAVGGPGPAVSEPLEGPGGRMPDGSAPNGTRPPRYGAAAARPPRGGSGGPKGWRAMVPAAAVAPEITACAETRGRLFCAFSGASERVVRALDVRTWATSGDGLNVTGLMDVVNLMEVRSVDSGAGGGVEDRHFPTPFGNFPAIFSRNFPPQFPRIFSEVDLTPPVHNPPWYPPPPQHTSPGATVARAHSGHTDKGTGTQQAHVGR